MSWISKGILRRLGRPVTFAGRTRVFEIKNAGCRQRLSFDFTAKRPASSDLDRDRDRDVSFLDCSNGRKR